MASLSLGSFEIRRSRALPIAILMTLLAGAGDAATTAETTFTLFYLVPLSIAVWYRSQRAGYVIIGLILACSLTVDVKFSAHPAGWLFTAWNLVLEAGLYVVFAYVLASLRARVELEKELRTQALDQLRHAERLTTVGKLAAGVAHELGTPLNVISGRADLIATGKVSDQDARQSAAIITQQVERATTTIRNLLNFSRGGGTHGEPTNLRLLCRETVELLAPLARRAGVEIELEGRDVQATVNRSEMQQVLSNLITNAVQAMPDGGRITIATRNETVSPPDAKGRGERECAVLSVRDRGTGIPLDVLPKVFDPFFTTKEVGSGTGLGLSVSYGIVRDHGGWIGVDTRLGEGTTFTVYLPT